MLAGISAGANDQGGARARRRGRRWTASGSSTIVCDSGERYMSLPFFSPDHARARNRQAAARRGHAPTSPRRATATRPRGASPRSRSSPAGPGCRRCSPTASPTRCYEAGVPLAAADDRLPDPRGHRGRDPPGGGDRRGLLHRPRLRRGDRRDRGDRRPRHALPGGDARRHRLPARQAPPDPRRQRHRRLRRQAARPDRPSATAPRSAPTRSWSRTCRRARPWSATPATR